MKKLLTLALACLAAAPALATEEARLLVALHDPPAAVIVAAGSLERLAYFSLPGPVTSMVALESGLHTVLTHAADDRVTLLFSGYRLEAHGDHHHLHAGSPFVLGTVNTGPGPSALSTSGAMVMIQQADGTVAVLDESLFGLSLNFQISDSAPPAAAPLQTEVTLGSLIWTLDVKSGTLIRRQGDDFSTLSLGGTPLGLVLLLPRQESGHDHD